MGDNKNVKVCYTELKSRRSTPRGPKVSNRPYARCTGRRRVDASIHFHEDIALQAHAGQEERPPAVAAVVAPSARGAEHRVVGVDVEHLVGDPALVAY
jgi:hypothetical protein